MERDPITGLVALGYANSNLDILDGDRIINIPDILLSQVSGNKELNMAIWSEGRLLLGTGLGIIVVDADRKEIADTWRVGTGGQGISVSGLAVSSGYLYAASGEGLKRGRYPGANLADPAAWETVAGGALAPGPCADVVVYEGRLHALKNDSLFVSSSGSWAFEFAPGAQVTALDATPAGLAIGSAALGKGRVDVLNASGGLVKVIQTPSIADPRQVASAGNTWWVADRNNGLLKVEGDAEERTFPNSPISTAKGEMVTDGHDLWLAAGSVNDSWNYQFNPNGLFRFAGNEWTGVNLYVYPQLDTVLDLVTVARDPATGKLFAGSFGGGLLEVGTDNAFRIFKQGTGLQSAIGDPGSYRVSGLAFDQRQNLWIANYGAPQDLVLRSPDGSWARFNIPFAHVENALGQLLVDDNGHLWMQSPKGNGLFCYDPGTAASSPGDDQWRKFAQGKGNGNLPTSDVRCLAKDRDGFIWVGTASGIGVIPCVNEVFTNTSCEAYLPVAVQNGVAGYLLDGEVVQSIAVDGANRKWVGTRNGVWLFTADGEKTLEHFTEANSSLLSNDVNHIAVDPRTGEVFFSTFNGICSWRSTATVADSGRGSVLVFPNPVPPGFGGTIAIRGLPDQAWVKITELDGRLVYQTRAAGGQAVWNGRNYKGERSASGAYLVLASDATNQEKVVAKIFFVK